MDIRSASSESHGLQHLPSSTRVVNIIVNVPEVKLCGVR